MTSDHVPLIAKLYMACILQMILSTASSCIVLHCYHRNHETSYLPLWLTKILVPKLATLLYVDNSAYKRRKTIDVGVQTDFTEDNYSNNVSIVADPLDFQLIPLNTTFETLTSIPELGVLNRFFGNEANRGRQGVFATVSRYVAVPSIAALAVDRGNKRNS